MRCSQKHSQRSGFASGLCLWRPHSSRIFFPDLQRRLQVTSDVPEEPFGARVWGRWCFSCLRFVLFFFVFRSWALTKVSFRKQSYRSRSPFACWIWFAMRLLCVLACAFLLLCHLEASSWPSSVVFFGSLCFDSIPLCLPLAQGLKVFFTQLRVCTISFRLPLAVLFEAFFRYPKT
jgi:hypothetical protein